MLKMCLSMGKIMANLFLEHFVTWDVLFYLQIFIMSVGRARTFLCFFERVRECIYSLQLFYWQTLKKRVFARQKVWIASKTWQRLGYVYG